MITTPISLQDLRRSLYVKAKAERTWRFWGLYVYVCKMETLREAWFNAPDAAAQQQIGVQIQQQAFDDVPFYPLGLIQPTTAFRQDITDVPEGFVIFWGVRRA